MIERLVAWMRHLVRPASSEPKEITVEAPAIEQPMPVMTVWDTLPEAMQRASMWEDAKERAERGDEPEPFEPPLGGVGWISQPAVQDALASSTGAGGQRPSVAYLLGRQAVEDKAEEDAREAMREARQERLELASRRAGGAPTFHEVLMRSATAVEPRRLPSGDVDDGQPRAARSIHATRAAALRAKLRELADAGAAEDPAQAEQIDQLFDELEREERRIVIASRAAKSHYSESSNATEPVASRSSGQPLRWDWSAAARQPERPVLATAVRSSWPAWRTA